MTTALEGLRILELGSGTAAALAGMVLAENGAELIKVEPPSGDPDRGRPGFAVWHRGKKSVVLDLHAAGDRARFRELAGSADALIESFRPGTAERLGVDYATLAPDHPGLVYLSLTGMGERGPLRDLPGYEGIVSAQAGRMAAQEGFREGPIFTPVPIGCYGAGMLGAQGVLAALWARRATGRGQRVHTSLLHALSVYDMTLGFGNRTTAPPAPGQIYGVMHIAFMTAPTKDGRYIQMCSRQPHLFRNWLKAMRLESLLDEPDLEHMPDLFPTEARMQEVVDAIQSAMRARTAEEWMEIFSASDVGGDPFLEAGEFLDHPQATLNGRRQVVVDPELGETVQIGPLGLLGDTPSVIGAPAPRLGEHTEPILRDLRPAPVHAPAPVTSPRRPLDGVTVVECGYFYATPFAATLLAEAGARVIKIEPSPGDPGRRNWMASYSKSMAGKQSVVADLKSDEGRRIVHELVERADIFIHNFRPGTPARLQIDYETLRAINPRLVYIYGSCFGSEGPWSHKAGFHSSPNAIVGCGIIESGRGNPPRNRTFADPAAALATAAIALVALHARERTGRGQYVETTMLTSMAYAVSEWSVRYPGKPERMPDAGQHGFHALHRLYPTAEGWLFLEVHRDREWRSLCRVVGLRDDDRADDAALAAKLARRLLERGADAWQTDLLAAGVPALRADGIDHGDFMLSHPHSRANRVAVEAEQDGTDWSPRAGPALEFSAAPSPVEPCTPLGAWTETVLRELGYDDATIEDYATRGITRAVGHGLPGAS